jgi:hypothetical protein
MKKAKKIYTDTIDIKRIIAGLEKKKEKTLVQNNEQCKKRFGMDLAQLKKEIGKPSPSPKLPKCFDIFGI